MPESGFKIEIAIPGSTSRTYREVMRRAKRTGFFDESESKLVITNLLSLFTVWEDFTFILFTAQKWTGFYMTIDDKPVMPYTNDYYYLIQDLKYCVNIRATAEEGERYCFAHCWGCRKLTSINRYIGEQNYSAVPWYKYGNFASQETWKINRKDILNHLASERDLKLLNHCPYYSDHRVTDTVNRLPGKFYIDDNFDILYKVDYEPNGEAVYIPASIHHKAQFEGYVKVVTAARPPDKPDISDMDQVNDYLDRMLKRRKNG
jgi:hypothetical protein